MYFYVAPGVQDAMDWTIQVPHLYRALVTCLLRRPGLNHLYIGCILSKQTSLILDLFDLIKWCLPSNISATWPDGSCGHAPRMPAPPAARQQNRHAAVRLLPAQLRPLGPYHEHSSFFLYTSRICVVIKSATHPVLDNIFDTECVPSLAYRWYEDHQKFYWFGLYFDTHEDMYLSCFSHVSILYTIWCRKCCFLVYPCYLDNQDFICLTWFNCGH